MITIIKTNYSRKFPDVNTFCKNKLKILLNICMKLPKTNKNNGNFQKNNVKF